MTLVLTIECRRLPLPLIALVVPFAGLSFDRFAGLYFDRFEGRFGRASRPAREILLRKADYAR